MHKATKATYLTKYSVAAHEYSMHMYKGCDYTRGHTYVVDDICLGKKQNFVFNLVFRQCCIAVQKDDLGRTLNSL